MNKQEFETLCRSAQAVPVLRKETKNGVIVIADGADPGGEFAYRTVWAFGKDDERLDIGRPLMFDYFYENKGVHRPVSQDIRIQAALEDALDHAGHRNGRH